MTYVDERVVELRFDNKQFEQETAKSMSTLDKLKEKLQFKNASAGAEQLQKAVANINVNPIVQGIDTIETRMSALGVAGKRIVENLVDWGMAGVKKITGYLSAPINQVIQGGKTRAQNIEQAKFMLKGLKVEWDAIKDDINYGVQDTAYGLDAAAKVASQLVASNVSLGKDMKTSLRAVSGVAAMTNSTYEDIGHIFTTVAGQGRVMGDQLRQLSGRGLNVAADLAKAMNTTEAEIREMVSKGKIDFQTFANAMDELYGEHAKKANETFTGALSNTKAALSRLGADIAAQGFTSIRDILIEIIPKLKEFKTKMKPAEDAIIRMVDAVGKLVQAFVKTIDIEKIVNFLSPKIEKLADTITGFATAWKEAHEITHKKYENIADYVRQARGLDTVTEATEEATDAMKKLYEISEEEKRMANDIWQYGTYGNGQDRVDALKEHYDIVQEYINKMIEFGWDEAQMNDYLAKQAEEHTKAVEEETKAVNKKNFINNLVDILKNLKRVFTNVFSSITNVLGVAFDSIGESLAGKGGGIMDAIVIITEKVADFSDKIAITKEKAEKLKPIFKIIISTIKLIGTILLNVGKAILIAIGYVAQFIKAISQNKVVRKIVESIGNAFIILKDAIVKAFEAIKNSGIWDKFVDILKKVGEFIGDRLVDAFNFFGTIGSTVIGILTEGFGFLIEKIGDLINKFGELNIIDKIKDFITNDILQGSWLEKLKTLIETLFVGKDSIFHTAYEFGSNLVKGFFEGLNNITLDDFEKASKIVAILGTTLAGVKWLYSMAKVNDALTNFTGTFVNMLGTLNTTIKKWGRKLDADAFADFADGIMKIVGSIVAIMFAMAYLESKGFDTHELILIAGGLAVGLVILVGGLRVLNTWLHKADVSANKTVNILGKAKTPSLALSLFAIGYAVGKIFDAIMSVYNLRTSDDFDDGQWMTALLMIVGVVGGLMLGLGLLSKNLKAISGYEGIALALGAVALLIWSIGSAMKSIAKGIQKYGSGNMWQAFAMVEIMLITLGGIGILLTMVTGAFKVDKMAGNPFKGMMGMMIGLTVLIRLAMVPLLEAIQKAYKQGKDGIDAIGDLQDIMEQLMIFIGILAVVGSLASRSINVGEFSTVAKSGPLFAIAAMVAALGLVVFALSKALKNLKGLDETTLNNFESFLTRLIGIFGLIVAIVAVLGIVSGLIKADIGIAGILLGLAAGIFAIAAVIAATAWAFKTFIDSVDKLPGTVDTLLEAFKKVSDNKEQLIDGLSETVAIAVYGAATGLVTGIKAKLDYMIDNLVEIIADSLSGAADAIMKNAPKFKKGMTKLRNAVAYAVAYGLFGGEDEKDSAFDMVFDIGKRYTNDKILEALLPGKDSTVGKADWYEEEMKEMRKKAEGTAEKEGSLAGTVVGGDYYNALYTAQAKEAEEAKKKNDFNLVDIVGVENAEKLANSKAGKAAEKYFGISLDSLKETADGYISDINGTINSINFTDIINKNMPKLTAGAGYTAGTDFLNELNEVIETKDPELIMAWAENYEGIEEISLDAADDMGTYANLGFTNYAEGVKAKKEAVENASKEVQDAAVNAIQSYEPEYYRLGKNLTWALSLGIADGDMTSVAVNNMSDVVRALKLKAEETAKISSPSKVFFKIGEFITMGLANGILSMSKAAEDSTETVAENSLSALEMILNKIFDTTMADMDTNPTITPVLDLSRLEEGLYSMGQMLNNNSSFGLAFGAANGFNNSLAMRNKALDVETEYDGTNVVEAITELRSDLNSMRETLGTIGFYVDGKQMAKAIADPMNKELTDISVATGRGVR